MQGDGVMIPGMNQAMGYLVVLIVKAGVAVALVVAGFRLFGRLREVIAQSVAGAGIAHAQQLAAGCYYLLMLATILAALGQLGIQFALLNDLILIVAGGLALAFGLSVGLGGREIVAGLLCGYYLRQRIQSGDRIRVAGYEGVVRDIGPVATAIETEEEGVMYRHSIPNQQMLSEAVR